MKSRFLPFLLLLAVLPVLIFRDYTPSNELRYLSIVDEALRDGSIFTFTNHGMQYADKPPLYFWILMLGKWLLGSHAMWFASLFSFVPALVVMLVMDRWVEREVSAANRYSAQLMLMSCGLFLGLAVVLRMDMLMCMFIVLALRTFYRMFKGQGSEKRNTFLFPFYVFMAVFSKGPVGILIPLLSTFVFLLISGRVKTFGHYWGWKTFAVLLSGCFIWFGGVCWEEGGLNYLTDLLFHQTVGRAVNAFDHSEPFYYYLISVWYSLAPWTLFLLGVIVAGVCRRLIRSDLERFFMTIILSTWLMLSCVSGKLAVYLLPAFPFFVYLAVLLLSRFRWNQGLALTLALPAVLFSGALPALIVLGQMPDTEFLAQKFFYVAGGVLTLSGGAALYFLYQKKSFNKTINTLVFGLFCAIFVGGWDVPAINSELGYSELCRKAVELSREKGTSGYCVLNVRRPENMDVYLHEGVKKVTEEDILDNKYQNTILMVSNKKIRSNQELQKFVDGKEHYVIGRFSVMVL